MARALYIHWPYCLKKCPYCDFNSHVREKIDTDALRNAFLAEMRYEHQQAPGETLNSVFFGGGTPSLMPPALVADVLNTAQKLWGFSDTVEITLEANPTSFEARKFTDFAAAGVNRVSLGVQSLNDGALRFLGREHSAHEALQALASAQKLFDRVSFDLIYALPDQTVQQWHSELERALALGTEHLSLYQLTIEPNTRFATDQRLGLLVPTGERRGEALYFATLAQMDDAGMPAYEISNFAHPDAQSRHNLTYWRYQDYIGIGPGAHGRTGGYASMRIRKPENWLAQVQAQGHGIKHTNRLSRQEQASEALLMGLRLTEGIDLAALAERFAITQDQLVKHRKVAFYTQMGALWETQGRLGVTAKGMILLDSLLNEIVSDTLVT